LGFFKKKRFLTLPFCAAVLIGRITGLARPSVRPSVPYRVYNLKTNGRRKTKIGVRVPSGVCANFQLKKVRRTAAQYVGTAPTQFCLYWLMRCTATVFARRGDPVI